LCFGFCFLLPFLFFFFFLLFIGCRSLLHCCYCMEFGFFVNFFCTIFLLCFYNTSITINFNILKYIKKIFKILIYCIFNTEDNIKKINKKSGLAYMHPLTLPSFMLLLFLSLSLLPLSSLGLFFSLLLLLFFFLLFLHFQLIYNKYFLRFNRKIATHFIN